MLTPSKLFVFRDSKGVFCPLDVYNLHKAMLDASGRNLSLYNAAGWKFLGLVAESEENAADWCGILNLESKRRPLPDVSKTNVRIQNDDEIEAGVLPPPPDEEVHTEEEDEATAAAALEAQAAAQAEAEAPPAEVVVEEPSDVVSENHEHELQDLPTGEEAPAKPPVPIIPEPTPVTHAPATR